jgi:hypothetical protein
MGDPRSYPFSHDVVPYVGRAPRGDGGYELRRPPREIVLPVDYWDLFEWGVPWSELDEHQTHAARAEMESMQAAIYEVDHPEQRYKFGPKASMHNARARDVGRKGTLTEASWLAWCKCFNWRCAYCEACPAFVLEHVVPLSRGGDSSLYNVVPACRSCNGGKQAKTPDEWLGPGPSLDAFYGRVAAAIEVSRGAKHLKRAA